MRKKRTVGAFSLTALLLANACSSSGDSGSASSNNAQPSGGKSSSTLGAGGGGGGGGDGGNDVGFQLPNAGGGPSTSGGAGAGKNCNPELPVTIRDFRGADDDKGNKRHPDFEHPDLGKYDIDDKEIVTSELGEDKKPVYAGGDKTKTTSGKSNFDQWFRDVKDVNIAIPHKLTLTKGGDGVYTYQTSEFFPINGKGFGNDIEKYKDRNYSFTLELHTEFEYKGGETFTFRGDDDVFAYINGKLVINLGGVKNAQEYQVKLDEKADELKLVKGKTYPLDFFFAERHTTESNFRIDTTIGCFTPPTAK